VDADLLPLLKMLLMPSSDPDALGRRSLGRAAELTFASASLADF
jgi:hypothetical protein